VWQKGIFYIASFALIAGILGVEMAAAQAKIGYVDSQKILSTFAAAIDAQKELENENTKWGQEVQKMQEELQTLQEELDQQSLLLSEAKRKEKEDELQALYVKAQQYQAQKWGDNGEFFKRQKELLQPIYDKINEVINRIGEEEGYDFVLDSVAGNILYAKEKFDITDKVLEELEKETPANTSNPNRN
jgi:outer membrane protein